MYVVFVPPNAGVKETARFQVSVLPDATTVVLEPIVIVHWLF